jgi:hypothetical protein
MTDISLLITTYNDPLRLEKTLSHHLQLRPQPFEIVVCDDGSKPETKSLVDAFAGKSRTPIVHVYQEDHGWDAPGIRNLGAITARGNYLVMTDGDSVPHPKFLQDHLAAAEEGWFVFGDRSHVNTEHVPGFSTRTGVLLSYVLRKKIRKRSVALRNAFEKPVVYSRAQFKKLDQLASVALCSNFGIWKNDFMAVNGFDESFRKWWPEDAECSARLLNSGLKIKKYHQKCLVYHLDHGNSPGGSPEAWRFAERSLLNNIRVTPNGIQQRVERMSKGQSRL